MDGWWELKTTINCKCGEVTEWDLEHIAEQIKKGFTSGELCHEHEGGN